ncbi:MULTISPECIES: hypothetical protein [unclassified Streptomyces]|uniref:hypothetical protein n=1 Tax=unclassified Streptomyces TaxID=2593676 RepID=UPI003425DF72
MATAYDALGRSTALADGTSFAYFADSTGESVPSWMIPLEIAVFIAVTLAVTALVLVCVQLVKSPVVIGTGYTALLLTGAAAVGIAAATRTRTWVMRRRTPRR